MSNNDCYLINDRCARHGGTSLANNVCRTSSVLEDVADERARQFSQYGTNEALRDGTGTPWLFPVSQLPASAVEASFRAEYEDAELVNGKPTWMQLVREEVAEAFAETDEKRLREELIQVAALCVSWVEKLDQRADRKFSTRVLESLEGLTRRFSREYTDGEWRDAIEAPLEARCVCGHTKAVHYLVRPTCMECGCPGLFVSTGEKQ